MNKYTLIARKNIEKQYDSECTIYELKPKVINNKMLKQKSLKMKNVGFHLKTFM